MKTIITKGNYKLVETDYKGVMEFHIMHSIGIIHRSTIYVGHRAEILERVKDEFRKVAA